MRRHKAEALRLAAQYNVSLFVINSEVCSSHKP